MTKKLLHNRFVKMVLLYCSTILFIFVTANIHADSKIKANSQQVFEHSSDAFVMSAFEINGVVPDAKRIWIKGELKQSVEKILQHRATFLRTKYWQHNGRSVWIINEIGKEKPITSGIIIDHKNGVSEIASVKVLAFRESRGWEVKHAFFTDQFKGVRRLIHKQKKKGLTPSIDGITGATLSVRALKKVAELALLLDEHVRTKLLEEKLENTKSN